MPAVPSIVIGIPTYRRPEQLADLLRSLVPELPPESTRIIVGDNDCGSDAPRVVAPFAREGLPVSVVPVPERGISQVRNALIRHATLSCPAWEYLVMLDDDGTVCPGWFSALLDGARRYDADVAAGPVLGDLPEDASLLARNSVYGGRARYPSGPVPMLNGAQNIVLSRRICDALGDPWFDIALGRSGGEDYHFFRRIATRGGRLAWCDDAHVLEPTPPDRLRWRPLLRRTFRSNAIAARTDIALVGSTKVWRDLRFGIPAAGRDAAAGLIRRDPDRLAKAALHVVALAGRAAGLSRRRRETVHEH